MKLNLDQVKKVAKLANLPVTEEECIKYSEQLSTILEYIEQLDEVDTSKAEPTFNVSLNKNITRNDSTGTNLTQEEALMNTPLKKEGFIATKGVFQEE